MGTRDQEGGVHAGSVSKRTSERGSERELDLSAMHHLAGFLIAMANLQARQVFQTHIGTPFELKAVEFTLLVLLQAHHGAAPKQLAQALNSPAPKLTVLVDRMVARGLVERRRSMTDGRALHVLLTAQGQELAQQVHAISLTMEDGMMQVLSPGERVMLRELLLKLRGVAAA